MPVGARKNAPERDEVLAMRHIATELPGMVTVGRRRPLTEKSGPGPAPRWPLWSGGYEPSWLMTMIGWVRVQFAP